MTLKTAIRRKKILMSWFWQAARDSVRQLQEDGHYIVIEKEGRTPLVRAFTLAGDPDSVKQVEKYLDGTQKLVFMSLFTPKGGQ